MWCSQVRSCASPRCWRWRGRPALGRILAQKAAVFGGVHHRLAKVELALGEALRELMRVEAHLDQRAHIVAHDPFLVDLVLKDHAIGHGAGAIGATRRFAPGADLGVAARAMRHMAGV
jgi:hypothetical protein